MTIYKFRVMYEDDDSIFRDLEIKPSQTISDLESVIISSYNLPATGGGHFFLSNDSWHRLKQITIAAQPEKKEKGKGNASPIPMLVALIDDPHQKFIYEYRGNQEFVFLVELLSLTGAEKSTVIYPVCTRQQGPSPFKKEELVAHYTKVADEGNVEEHRIDDDEVDIENMGEEGAEEDLELGDTESETEVAEEAEEVEDMPDDAESEEFTEEDFGSDFTDGDDKD